MYQEPMSAITLVKIFLGAFAILGTVFGVTIAFDLKKPDSRVNTLLILVVIALILVFHI